MRCSRLRSIPLAIALLSLQACATAVSSACPAVKTYSPEIEDQAAAEMEQLGPASVIVGMIADYKGLREQARACAKGRPV